jgi:hypothetical protein
MNCIVCGKEITTWDRIKQVFYAPVGCSISFVWKFTCSKKCWSVALEEGLKDPEKIFAKCRKEAGLE